MCPLAYVLGQMAVFFFLTALIYGSVGFGGGSTYTALLALGGTDYRAIPTLSLVCNLIVVSSGVWHFYRKDHVHLRTLLPWIIPSIPASFVGALLPIPEVVFTGLLGAALSMCALRLLWPAPCSTPPAESKSDPPRARPLGALPALIGTATGFIAGMTGIGGGIFLAPILHIFRWAAPKRIAGACAVFIFVNSLAGLAGQALKAHDADFLDFVGPYWPLFPAVLLGGQIGAWIGSSTLPSGFVKKCTGAVVLYAAVRLLIKFFDLVS